VPYGAWKGWVWLGEGGEPAPARGKSRETPADEARLARARRRLGPAARERPLGAHVLVTDVDDPALLESLARVAAALPATYAARYLESAAVAADGATVVLFAHEKDYEAFESEDAELSGLRTRGNAGGALAVLVAGGSAREDLVALLVHELTHLLNGRAFGARLPVWLEEGIAEELSYS